MDKRSFPVGEFAFHFQTSRNVVFCTQPNIYVSLSADWMGTGPEPAWETPALLVGQDSGVCVCEGVSRHQQISITPSAAIPVAICPFKVQNDTKIFLIFLQLFLCLLPESYLDSGGRGGECSLSARAVSHYFPSTTLHLFFMTVIQRHETDVFSLQGFLFN